MFGAIIGDIVGSPYEFDFNNIKTKNFPLFSTESQFTDDTVMTLAVGSGLLNVPMTATDEEIKESVIDAMLQLGNEFPNAGYGNMFLGWLNDENPKPYYSFGNGSAMRVSSAAWLYNSLEEVQKVARLTAEVTHNHPEGIKGAEATASAIFLARTKHDKSYIRDFIEFHYGYDLNRTCDEIRPTYVHVESCQETVPEAIIAFLESNNFEDALRTAVSLGGDSDTLAAITCSIAEGFYGIPEWLKQECYNRLPDRLTRILSRYESTCGIINFLNNPEKG